MPYDMVSPGFEAVYTGEKSTSLTEKTEGPFTITTDEEGNIIKKWSTWTWTFLGQEVDWNDEIKYINQMQEKLGHLSDEIRKIRAHIGSLVPCDNGFPVSVDELLEAFGKGKLGDVPFNNGCWAGGMWWEQKGTQPKQDESMQAIEEILTGYLAGKPKEKSIEKYPHAKGFINRTYEWLGPVEELTMTQKLLMERMLLPFEFFTWRNRDYEGVNKNCFKEGGRGRKLDTEIEKIAGLPNINAKWPDEYHKILGWFTDPTKKELYIVCRNIRDGIYELSDCHHNTFRFIENWLYGIARGNLGITTRKKGTERERLGQLLFGYVMGLDKWLLGKPMQFLLLDLGHVDIGFDPKNEILQVYAYLGEEKTQVKEWLAACLWHNLMYNSIVGNPGGLIRYKELLERAKQTGINLREWMDSVLGKDT